ncbi:hypothetical protein RB195_009147 [Necator americanus]|uniref:Protein kinase domain-containing protein n=1 Tax=Necator americanus TaxID=51031 RepID=A0ABR1CVD2_NECAM
MSLGKGEALIRKDSDDLPTFQSFEELKRCFQEKMARGKQKGEESEFSAAVRESNDRRASELAGLVYYYWSSVLDCSNVDCVLGSKKQCVIIDAPPTYYGGRERAQFLLCVKEDTIKYYSVKCAANELIVSGTAKKLNKFVAEEGLQPVQRQYVWRNDQLGPILENMEFPFDSIYEIGKVNRRHILFPTNKGIPVISIVVADLNPEERNVIINDLCDYKDFGCLHTQRLWGSIVTDAKITVLLENSPIDSLSNYVSVEQRNNDELLKFARHMATAVVVFGLSTGLYPKRIYLNDVDRCRWIPWECLNGEDGVEPEPYDKKGMIWTLATIIWSMFHRAAIPFENETVNEIRRREYRKGIMLDVIEQLLPNGVLELLQSCWLEREKRPTSRHVLKTIKKLEQLEMKARLKSS